MNLDTPLDIIIDEINNSLFNDKKFSISKKKKYADILMNYRYSESSKYYGMFDPKTEVFDKKIKLFTGEKINTYLAIRYILSLEAAKILFMFNKDLEDHEISSALDLFDREARLFCFAADDCNIGECAHSGLVYINYFINTNGNIGKLDSLVDNISMSRDKNGGWEGYPFYYTIFSLMNLNSHSAKDEIEYALTFYNTNRKKLSTDKIYDSRRKSIMNKVLEDSPLTLM